MDDIKIPLEVVMDDLRRYAKGDFAKMRNAIEALPPEYQDALYEKVFGIDLESAHFEAHGSQFVGESTYECHDGRIKDGTDLSPENGMTPEEDMELKIVCAVASKGGSLDGLKLFRRASGMLSKRHWALLAQGLYGFNIGSGPDYPTDCYQQSILGYHLPES